LVQTQERERKKYPVKLYSQNRKVIRKDPQEKIGIAIEEETIEIGIVNPEETNFYPLDILKPL